MSALKKVENHWFVLYIQRWGVPGEFLGGRWWRLGGPWGSLGSLGVARTSLSGSEWTLGVDVPATDHFVMYIGGNMMILWSPLGLRVSLSKLRHLWYRVVLGPYRYCKQYLEQI